MICDPCRWAASYQVTTGEYLFGPIAWVIPGQNGEERTLVMGHAICDDCPCQHRETLNRPWATKTPMSPQILWPEGKDE